MGMSLDGVSLALPEVELEPVDWAEYLDYLGIVGVPSGLLSGADPSAFHTLAARLAGENRRDRDCFRPRRRLRRVQHVDAGAGTAARARHGARCT